MKAVYRLKKNYQYNYAYKKGSSLSDKNLVLVYCPHRGGVPKFGFSVSSKYGGAVKRNRIRRQLKECATFLLPRVKGSFTYIFIPKANAGEFAELLASMKKLLASADLLTKEQGV